jgi:hypothetical protein
MSYRVDTKQKQETTKTTLSQQRPVKTANIRAVFLPRDTQSSRLN